MVDSQRMMDYGIDFDKGMRNCMNNTAFYEKIVTMFLEDECFRKARVAYAERNMRELFNRMHEMKGISGNAALMELYKASVPLVELIRKGDADWDDVAPLFEAADRAYTRACEGLRAYLEE